MLSELLSATCFNLDQSKILLSGKGLSTVEKKDSSEREEWILLQWLSSVLGKNTGLARDLTSNTCSQILHATNWAMGSAPKWSICRQQIKFNQGSRLTRKPGFWRIKILKYRFDPQEKSLMRHFDQLKILGTVSKFNTTYQKSIQGSWKVDMCKHQFVILASFIVWHCLFAINYM